ncbi:MAG: hypothetical protein EXQ56_09640 [Acidobacteria bacterium]|nr:hypothetical protein [Acidobacteriota bacterium]
MTTQTTPGLKTPQVVIAFLDGRRLSGSVFDFSPMKDRCRIFPAQKTQAGEGEVVDIRDLKAIFFLQDAGEGTAPPTHPPGGPQRRRLEVLFRDGERLEGTTEGYSKERQGFFIVPEDPTGKIIRVYVVNANVKEVQWVQAPPSTQSPAPNPPSS